MYYQEQVAQRVRLSVLDLGTNSGHILTRRPFQAMWYTSQVSICLALWNYDRNLHPALELAKSFLIPVETLDVLWPCPGKPWIIGYDKSLASELTSRSYSSACALSRGAKTRY